MPRKVWIKVKGTQASAPGEYAGDVELLTEGMYRRRNGMHYLTYDESEVTGMAGTTTTIKVTGGSVSIQRTGAINAQLQFEPGKSYSSRYETGYGFISMNTHTNKVRVDINERSGGDISVEYCVEMDGTPCLDNKFDINFMFGTPTGKMLPASN
ncbi:MAG TPA: DUF1934 domain-containing protein [Clostridiales bacterium]|nr:DUF1934 domain-containing protein [Clostridiales bacterium]